MNTLWRIELLGGLRARQGERVVSRFRSRQAGGLLAYLAFYPQRTHSREALIEQLWPECDPEAGRNRFRVALSSLRRQLEPPGIPAGVVLVSDRLNLQLNPAAVVTDVALFEAALQAAERTASRVEKQARLVEAVEQYQGELLPGYFDEWVFPERGRLAEAFAQALRQLTALLAESGDLAGALQHAHRTVAADPLSEEAHAGLIRLLIAAGQPDHALRQYRELERLLEQELGATPSAEIHDLVSSAFGNQHGGTETWRGMRKDAETQQDHEALRPLGKSYSPPPIPSVPPCLRVDSVGSLPSGTVTFLLAEIEATVPHEEGDDGSERLTARPELLRELLRQHGGVSLGAGHAKGAELVVVFERAGEALAGVVAAQRALAARAEPLPVRMALHTGDLPPGAADEGDAALRCARRILAASHGGQILCSEEAAALVRRELTGDVRLVDLGAYHLPGAAAPERLFRVDYPELGGRELPPLRATPVVAGHVPLSFTSFFGRETELAQLCKALGSRLAAPGDSGPRRADSLQPTAESPSAESPRLITLTGPGGSGKSRLALEVARQLQQRFRGRVPACGCWFVSLADLTDPGLIPDKLLGALHLPRSPQGEPLEQVVSTLSAQPSLLVLDNYEHLVNGGAALLRTLLERIPSLAVLITSRQRLGLEGEREFPLGPLPLPGVQAFRRSGVQDETPEDLNALAGCPSVRLFVDRAQAVQPDFQVTRANAAAVAALCARLEGLPLAIELAAARARMLTPRQMLARLEEPFELLVSRQRDADPRHRSLRAALDWSYQLLSPPLQQFFAGLSVFRGGFTLEAAAAVCSDFGFWILDFGLPAKASDPPIRPPLSDSIQNPKSKIQNERTLEALTSLQEGSLLVAEAGGEEMRYRLLETLREYAADQLAPEEQTALARRHACFYLELAEQAEPKLLGPDQATWLDRLEAEHDNLRAALEWCLATVESGQWVMDSLEIGLRYGAALWAFWWVRGYLSEGREQLGRLLACASDAGEAAGAARVRAKAHACAGLLAHFQGDHMAARRFYEQSLAGGRELGDQWVIAVSLTGLGFLAHYQGDRAAACALLEESRPIWQALGDRWGLALALDGLGSAALDQGDTQAARALYQEGLAIQRARGDQWGVALSLRNLGGVARREGDLPAARASYRESLALRVRLGDRRAIAECLEGLASVAVAAGEPRRAARWLGAAAALREATGAPVPPAARADYEAQLAAARAALGPDAFAAAWEEGRALTHERAAADALDP